MESMLIIKNILKKIKIHPIFFFFAFISAFTGLFKEFLVFSSLIFFHESGHIITSIFFNWKIDSINFYPYGGMIKFNEKINKPISEEVIITISGLLFQLIYYFIIVMLYNSYKISDYTFILFKNYHYSIFFFNLIPIYPLDGIKLINLLLCKNFSFNFSHILSIIISYIFIIIFMIFSYTNSLSMNTLLMISLLINKVIEEHKQHKYYCNKFIFERYLYKFNFRKTKIIDNQNLNNMFRDKKHIFKYKNEYITENSLLKKKFKR